MADHRVQAELGYLHVDVPVATSRRASRPMYCAKIRRDPARDVDAHVAVKRGADVVRAIAVPTPTAHSLVPATRVERAEGSSPLLVEDVAHAPRCRA